MRDDALAVANYFIGKANKENKELRPLKLMKLVYIAHGYMLALLDKSALNERFDWVEAWKYGPVIPSIYHTFKVYGNSRVMCPANVFIDETLSGDDSLAEMLEPKLEDPDFKKVCDFVWNRYMPYPSSSLITILHGKGTPWYLVYREGQNNIIPDSVTKAYYKGLVARLMEAANEG